LSPRPLQQKATADRRTGARQIPTHLSGAKKGNRPPFARIEPPYITCWKGFETMLRPSGGIVAEACFLDLKAL
jgi:hypothetical protein